jgi:DNA repair protein RecO (recombination protein O)
MVAARRDGRVGLVARGVHRPRSTLGALLQPFRPLLLSWRGRGELATLTAAEPGEAGPALAGRTLLSGFYVNELVLRLLPRQDPHPMLFRHYLEALAGLADGQEAASLRRFEKALLDELGYGLVLDRAADTGAPLEPGRLYAYRFDHGPVAEPARGREALAVHGDTLLGLAEGRLVGPRQQREARALMRMALARLLGDRPLHSRRLYAELLRGG